MDNSTFSILRLEKIHRGQIATRCGVIVNGRPKAFCQCWNLVRLFSSN